jgi:hypothetical protein
MNDVKMTAEIVFQFQQNCQYPKKMALDFVLKAYKQTPDQEFKKHLQDVFWYIVDNYVENNRTLNDY